MEEPGMGEVEEVVPAGSASEQANEGDERFGGPVTVLPDRKEVRRLVPDKEAPIRIVPEGDD